MKVTTLRFDEDLWSLLAAEAERSGVSVAQYVREAALARAAFAAGARAGVPEALLAQWSGTAFADGGDPVHHRATQRLIAALQRSVSADLRQDAHALRAESQQTRRKAQDEHARARGATPR
jgi:hypothetical protein